MFLLSAAHFRYEILTILHKPQATLFLCTAGVRRIKKALSFTLNAAASFVKPFLSHATAAIKSLGWFVSKSMHQKISFFMLLILYIKRIPIFNPLYARPHDSKRYAPFLSHACL